MKSFLLIFVIALSVAAVMAGDGDYLDELDVESMLNDEQQLKEAFACVVNPEATCTEKLSTLRDGLSKTVPTSCGDCTEEQKQKFVKYDKMLKEKYPTEYQELLKKFASKAE